MRRRRSFARKTWLVAIAALVVVGVATAATRSSTADYSARNIADIVLIDQHESRYTHLADSHRFKEWWEALDREWRPRRSVAGRKRRSPPDQRRGGLSYGPRGDRAVHHHRLPGRAP